MEITILKNKSGTIFPVLNGAILSVMAVICLLPVINLLAISLSGNAAVTSGAVGIIPIDFTLDSYGMVIANKDFWRGVDINIMYL